MHNDMAVCLPREALTVALVRTAIAHTLDLFGVDQDCLEDIRLAVSEACTNVINHAADDDEYEVAVHIEDHECVVSVKNSGSGFDADSLTGVMPSPDSARGRGVAIMNAVTDTVDLTSSPQAGTVVRLVKTLTYRSDSPLARLQHRRQR